MDHETHNALETKSGIPLDAMVTHAEMMRAFEAFKETNDERLALSEKRAGDVVLDEKLERINAAMDAQARRLDEITLKAARPALGGERGAVRSAAALEHKQAFDAYVRAGESGGLRALEIKALSVGSNPDGGYLVPPEVETEIGRRLTAISPIRSIAGVRTISGNVYKKPFMTAGPAVGWVGETDARTQTTSPTLDELSFPAMELYAMPAATSTLLEDAAVNIDEWLAQEVEQVFAAQEGTAFVTGDGSNKPKGFLELHHGRQRVVELGQCRLHRLGRGRRLPGLEPVRRAGRPDLRGQCRLPAERRVRDEPQDAKRDPQVQGHDRQLSLAAAGGGGRTRLADDLRGGRGRGHAGHRGQFAVDRLRRFQPRLSDRRPRRRHGAARSLHRQALRAVLYDQARRRRRAGLRRHQADEVRGELRPHPQGYKGVTHPATPPRGWGRRCRP